MKKKGDKIFDFKVLASVSIVGTPVFLGCLALYFLLGSFGLPWQLFFLLYILVSSPLTVVGVYWLFRSLIPITGRMPAKGFKQWVLLYPLIVGFCAFWAFLSFLLEYFIPSLPPEDAHFTIPSITIAAISVVLCIGLRSRTERVLRRIFGQASSEETSISK